MNIRANLNLIEAVAALLAPYRDDEETFLDTLDGETDILDLLDQEIAGLHGDEALAAAIKVQEADLRTRRERIEFRADAHKKALKIILNAAGLQKAERPGATVSIRQGSMSVRIVDEADIPSQLMREKITRAPDKAAIKEALEAGETIPGAEMARGDETVSVRVK